MYSIEKETIEYNWIETLITHNFEGYLMPIPLEWDKYLSHLHGDYMAPPPKNNRFDRHSVMERDLGDFNFSKYNKLLK